MSNFISSITLQFRDAFSSGFSSAQNSLSGMKGALGEMSDNKAMFDLAGDLSLASSRFEELSGRIGAMIDRPSMLAGQFDSSMRNIQSLTGETNESLAQLSKELLSVGSGAVAGPNAIADAYYNIASGISEAAFGADTAAVRMNVLETASHLAEAGQANLGAATSGLISVVNAYGVSAENVVAQSDVFFQTVRMGVGSLDGFVSAMATVAGTAANLRVGFDEVGSAMAYITSKGPSEAEAATQINAAMTALLKPNADMITVLQKLGFESGSSMIRQYGLAESLYMIKSALGGSDDAMAQALGRTEALKAATYLTQEGYENFAASYAEGLSGATAAALEAQAQSYEARVAKLQAASDSLQIQMGDDINAIKGFFVDMGAGFLNHVVSPLMSSPVGGVFQRIAAGAGLLAKGVLDMGSGALNTATQLVTLTATLQNAGGFSKLFGSALGGIASPLRQLGASIAGMIGPLIAKTSATFAATAAEVGFAGAMWTTAGAVWAVTWPVLAVIAAVALLALGGYMLIKHWDTVSAFFVGLWIRIKDLFFSVWEGIKNYFVSIWNGIVAVVMTVANWFPGVWEAVAGAFAAAWGWVSNLFTSIWEGIKGVVLGFIEWLSPVVEAIIAPFKAIGNAIGAIIGSVKGWFGETTDMGRTEIAAMNTNHTQNATAQPVETAPSLPVTQTATTITAPSLAATNITAAPMPAGAALSAGTATAGENTALAEHTAAASRKGITGTVSAAASNAFMDAGSSVAPSVDISDFENNAAVNFQEAVRPRQAAVETLSNTPENRTERSAPRVFNIQNVTLNADDIYHLLDFARQLEEAIHEPVEALI